MNWLAAPYSMAFNWTFAAGVQRTGQWRGYEMQHSQ